jgi:hypothetical protein
VSGLTISGLPLRERRLIDDPEAIEGSHHPDDKGLSPEFIEKGGVRKDNQVAAMKKHPQQSIHPRPLNRICQRRLSIIDT